MNPLPTLALIHSPLVTETTWKYLAPFLQQKGYPVVIATLQDSRISARHWWHQHTVSIVESLSDLSSPYLLVGHSGTGPLLPLIAERLPSPPSGYIFVDAGILWEPASRLAMMYAENETWGQEFEAYLRGGGDFPAWTDEQLQDILPNPDLRREVIESLRPKELSFFIETIPIPAGWDSLPCGYLQLSATYQPYADAAQAKGWVVKKMDGHHFSMMTHPNEVAEILIRLTRRLR
jgi:hypothetical protein